MSYTRVVPRPSVATAILPAVEVSFRLVDVFTPVPFAGNQLCVAPDPPVDLDATTMQALAQEIGLSETTFVTGVRSGGYDVRIFTPDAELPFAGHPTLGTAFTLASEDRVGAHAVQTSAAGDVPVGGAVIRLAAANRHTCALLEGGAVHCWGQGMQGQLASQVHAAAGLGRHDAFRDCSRGNTYGWQPCRQE